MDGRGKQVEIDMASLYSFSTHGLDKHSRFPQDTLRANHRYVALVRQAKLNLYLCICVSAMQYASFANWM